MYVNLIGYELTFNVGFFSTKTSFQIFFIYFYSKYDPNQYNLLENVRIVAGSEGGGSRGRARAPPRHVSGEASAARSVSDAARATRNNKRLVSLSNSICCLHVVMLFIEN